MKREARDTVQEDKSYIAFCDSINNLQLEHLKYAEVRDHGVEKFVNEAFELYIVITPTCTASVRSNPNSASRVTEAPSSSVR